MEAVPMQRPEQSQKSGHARRLEPTRLIVCRVDGKIEGCSGLVPHAAVVAGDHAEAVVAWRKIVIECLPPSACVLPITIVAFQLDAKTDLLRRDQAESGIVDFEIANQRGQAQVRRSLVGLAVSGDLLDVHRRWEFVEGKVTRIDYADAVARRVPQFAILGFSDLQAVAASDRPASDSIGTVENRCLDRPSP